MALTARTFTASLKPAWTAEKTAQFCRRMQGSATVFVVNHDSDVDEETNSPVEEHTHVLLEYETPRYLTTAAKLLEVAPNFIEVVKSKKSMLRYLTHLDEPEKHQYSPEEVVTNSAVPYAELVVGQGLNDREIAQYLADGRGMELLSVVPASKLRTIQAFLHYDRSGAIQTQLKAVIAKLERLERFVDTVEKITAEVAQGINATMPQLVGAMLKIGNEIEKVRLGGVQTKELDP